MKTSGFLIAVAALLMSTGCSDTTRQNSGIKTDEDGYAILTDEQVDNLVRRSYQYVALYNINNKFALGSGPMATQGWNKGLKNTELLDHTMNAIARPNNDNLYQTAMLDLRPDPVVFKFPAIDSKYISLMTTAYDHYVQIPLSTVFGDFKEPTTILLYSARTKNYAGEPVEGIDEIFEMTGDFVSAVLRVTPHAAEPERFNRIVNQIGEIEGMSLSKFKGGESPALPDTYFPPFGATDADVFENNLLEVMQFIFNHLTFDPNDEMDSAVLAAYKPLGIEPGKPWDADTAVKIDGSRFRAVAERIKEEQLGKMMDPTSIQTMGPKMFRTKGNTDLETILAVSVIGPIGQPIEQAMYPPVVTADRSVMNAQYDYVIRMTAEELPPAKAFWSLTLYNKENGFFIPNDHKKYSVGENAGYQLNEDGGIEVYIATEKPEGVPMDNWLPITREDQDLDIILRIYAPDLERMKTWSPPTARRL